MFINLNLLDLFLVVLFLGLVNYVLLDYELLKFAHLFRIQFQPHFLCCCDQIRVNLVLFLYLILNFLIVLKFFRVSSFVDDLFDLHVCFVCLSHESFLCHFKWILILTVVFALLSHTFIKIDTHIVHLKLFVAVLIEVLTTLIIVTSPLIEVALLAFRWTWFLALLLILKHLRNFFS